MLRATGRITFIGAAPALLLLLVLPDGWAQAETVRSQDTAELIEALGADSGAARDEAFEELARRGEQVQDALERAATAKDPRVRAAVGRLLERLEQEAAPGGLRLKDRFGAPKQEDGPAMPAFPRLRPFPFEGGTDGNWGADFEEWNRQWNSEIEEWNRQLDAWVRDMLEQQGGLGAAPGARGSFKTFRADEEGTTSYDLKVDADGRVTARITREQDGERTEETVEAESMEQFKVEYPEVAEALGLDFRVFGGPGGGFGLRFAPGFERFGLTPPRPVQPWQDGGSALRRVGGPRLGVQVSAIAEDDPLRAHVALDPGLGLLIREVVPGSLAAELDVRENDILLEVGGVEVGSPADVRAGLEEAGTDTVEVTVIREGTRRVLRRGV